jgi:protein-S-isoprenylcysteine O-methyltransferase Ste14
MNNQSAHGAPPAGLLRHLRAVVFLPLIATVVVPGAIVLLTATHHVGWGLPAPLRPLPMALGGGLIAAGLVLFGWTVALFASVGEGTLAPWDATRRLVVHGVYRHVRNPMISGVLCILLGETALLGSLPLLGWCAGFLLVNALYMPLVEERGLERRFGGEYRLYKGNVPRWLPRLRPWSPPPGTEGGEGRPARWPAR